MVTYAVSIESVFTAIGVIQKMLKLTSELQNEYMEARYKRIHALTKSRTMVATGELRSTLFHRVNKHDSKYTRYTVGYGSTSNNQAFHQEFDTNDPVHHSKGEHKRPDGRAKCSRGPVDIYSHFGSSYKSNRSARRRALASSIEESLVTQVNFGVFRGSKIQYEPDLSNLARKLGSIARAVTRV